MAGPNIPDLAEVLEGADDGKLVDLAMYRAMLGGGGEQDPVTAYALEFRSEIYESMSRIFGEIRREFIVLMKHADRAEDRDVHMRLGEFVNDLDDFAAILAERWAS